MSTMIQVTEPTMVLNEEVCKSNIARMAAKAKAANVVFRPHFKTHQSREIGEWFRASGVDKITVSSLNMAMKFAEWGWNDITVAFPVNCLEHEKINALAAKIRLNFVIGPFRRSPAIVRMPEISGRRISGSRYRIPSGWGRRR